MRSKSSRIEKPKITWGNLVRDKAFPKSPHPLISCYFMGYLVTYLSHIDLPLGLRGKLGQGEGKSTSTARRESWDREEEAASH